MKKVHESDITPSFFEGEKGTVEVRDVIDDEELNAGIRIVTPDSDVPRKTHSHPQKQIIYVISGNGQITNGSETFDFSPGDFILLESNEEHYVSTGSEEVKVFEIKF
ncbi:MAG: cupin domain-containing protein [Candidatus Thorarchaeota archaeon]